MQPILKEIRYCYHAEIIAKVTKVDVEIVDAKLVRIAGTGVYREALNKSMAGEGFVYEMSLCAGS